MAGDINGLGKVIVYGAWAGTYIYAGGAIDYGDPLRTHAWRHDLASISEYGVYCPICANRDAPDIETIMSRNNLAVVAADRAVFLLDGMFTVGTPIEIAARLAVKPPETTAIIHPDKPGLYIQTWRKQGVLILPTLDHPRLKAWLT